MKRASLRDIANAAFFEPGDVAFIERICAGFPHIENNLMRLAAELPADRPALAWQMLGETPRRGILEMGVPPEAGESVQDHAVHCMDLVAALAEPEDVEHLVAMMRVHDLAEAVTGDFTPRDKIAKADKHRLERIVFGMIYDSNPDKDHVMGLWEEYEGNETSAARLAHDIDKIDLALTAQEYMRRFPLLQRALHREFLVPMEHWLHTDIGRAFFESVRDRSLRGKNDNSPFLSRQS